MKHFFDTHYGGQPYNARERREEAKAQYKKGHKHAGSSIAKPAGETKPAAPKAAPKAAPVAAPKAAASTSAVKKTTTTSVAKKAPASSSSSSSSGADAAALTEQLAKLTLTIEGLEKERNFYVRHNRNSRMHATCVAHARTLLLFAFSHFTPTLFCHVLHFLQFGKLREIEILAQDDEENPDPNQSTDLVDFKKKALAILYATDENAEFQVPENEEAAQEEPPAEGEEGLLGEEELAAE